MINRPYTKFDDSSLFDRLLAGLALMAAVCLALMMISVNFDIVLRYFFNKPMSWVTDLTEYGLLYILFLSSGWVLAEDKHVAIDVVVAACTLTVRKALDLTSSMIGATASGIFFWFSAALTWRAYEASEILWGSVIIAKWPVLIVIPIGSLLLTIQFLRRAWRRARQLFGHDVM